MANYKNYNLITDKQIYNINSVNGTSATTVNTCRIWFSKPYDPTKNSVLNSMMSNFPLAIHNSISINNPYKYTYDSDLKCSMVHAGLLKPGATASNVGIILLPSYNGQTFGTDKHHDITPIAFYLPLYRCYSFYSVNGYILYDFVSKYNNSTSANTIVNVTLTGDSSFATTEATWGLQRVWGGGDVDKTYTVDSYLPRAAVHAGFIQDKETKTVSIKLIGSVPTFSSSTAYNITTLPFDKPYYAFQFVQPQATTGITTGTTIPVTKEAIKGDPWVGCSMNNTQELCNSSPLYEYYNRLYKCNYTTYCNVEDQGPVPQNAMTTDSSTKTTEPMSYTTDSSTTTTAPVSYTTDSSTTTTEPVSYTTDSSTTTTDPVSYTTDSSTKTTDPVSYTTDSSTTTTAPVSYTTDSSTTTTAPMSYTTDSSTTTTAPMSYTISYTTSGSTTTTQMPYYTKADMPETTMHMTTGMTTGMTGKNYNGASTSTEPATYYTDSTMPETTMPMTTGMGGQNYSGASMSTIVAQLINPEAARSGNQSISYTTTPVLYNKIPPGNVDTIFNIPGTQ